MGLNVPSLDTNVLVRFLVQDDVKQLALARQLIAASIRKGETLFVPVTVMLEVEWVLRSSFGFEKKEVVSTLASLLATPELSIESESAIEVALAQYQKSKADFSDCVHLALAHQADELPFWTLDKAAAKLDGAKLLSA